MLLESARHRLLTKFGSLQEACNQLTSRSAVLQETIAPVSPCSTLARCSTMPDERDAANPLHFDSVNLDFTSTEFEERAVSRLGMTHSEAAKIFRLIDIDDIGSVSVLDFIR